MIVERVEAKDKKITGSSYEGMKEKGGGLKNYGESSKCTHVQGNLMGAVENDAKLIMVQGENDRDNIREPTVLVKEINHGTRGNYDFVGDNNKAITATEEHSLNYENECGMYEREVIELTGEKSMNKTVQTEAQKKDIRRVKKP